jgi:hypothetical protein
VLVLELGCGSRFTEATSNDFFSFGGADCARIADAFTIPNPIGAVTASTPAAESTSFLAGLSPMPT